MTSPNNWQIAAVIAVVLFVAGLIYWIALRRRAPRRSSNPHVDALALLIDGNPDDAFTKLQETVRLGNAPTDAYIRLGTMLRERGEPNKALQIHRSLTVRSGLTKKEHREVYLGIAQDYSQLGRPEQAVTTLETAVKKLGIRDREVFLMLAREAHSLGRIEDAYEYLREVKKSGHIGDRELGLYLGTAGANAMERQQYKEAGKLLGRALKHDPNCAFALLTLGDLEEKQDKADGALRHWKQAAVLSPELAGGALSRMERLMFQRGHFGDIEAAYQEVLGARPSDEHATLALASFYRKQGRGEDAIAILEEFQSLHPDSVGATLLLTSLYASLRDSDTVERFLEENESHFAQSVRYRCELCGHVSMQMRWHCPECNNFDTFTNRNEH